MDDKIAKNRAQYKEQQYKMAMCIYRLQREAGMSFREVRIAMIDRGEGALVTYDLLENIGINAVILYKNTNLDYTLSSTPDSEIDRI